MSIVNKMLRDLEQRKENNQSHATYQPPSQRRASLRAIVFLLLAAVVLVAAIWLWMIPATPVTAPEKRITPINQQRDQASIPPVAEDSYTATSTTGTAEPAVSSTPASADDRAFEGATVEVSVNSPRKDEVTAPEPPPTVLVKPGSALSAVSADEQPKPVLEVLQRTATAQEVRGSLREQIRVALSNNNETLAIALLHSLVEKEPENVNVKKKLAALMFGEGQVTATQTLLSHSIHLHPLDESLRLMQARLLRQQNQLAAAYEVLVQLPITVLPSLEFLGVRASLAQELGYLDAALADYRQLTALDSENAKWWLGLAVVADKLQQSEVAAPAYKQAYQLNQLSVEVQDFIRERMTSLAGQH